MADKTVRIDIVVDEDTKGAKKAAEAVAGVRKESEKLGDQFDKTGGSAKKLSHELKQLQVQRRALAERLTSGDADDGDQKEFNRVNRRIGWLKKLRAAARVADKTGENAMPSALDMGGEGIKPRNAAIGGLVAAGVMGSPAIGAVLAGMFTGTLVGAAMAGGIIAATHDNSVRQAASFFGDEISKEFFSSGRAFVEPVKESLGILQRDFQDLHLGDAFAKAAPYVTVVAHGIGDLFKNLMPGFNRLLDKAGPYSEVFAEGLAGLGSALGQFMDEISSSPGAIEGLQGGLLLLNGTIIVLGRSLNVLSDIFDYGMRKNAEWVGLLEDIPGWQNIFGPLQDTYESIAGAADKATLKMTTWKQATEDAAERTRNLANALDRANKGFKDYYDTQSAVDDAIIAQRMGLIDLAETLQENGKHWENNTKAGLENQAALRTAVEQAKATRDAKVAAAGDDEAAVAKANREYDKAIAKLKEMATKAGLAEEKFNDLAGSYTIKFYLEQVEGKKVVDWSMFRNAERGASGGKGKQGSAAGYGYSGFSSGGTTPAFEPFRVHDGEVMYSDRQHYVANAAQVNAMSRSGGGMPTLRVIVEETSGRVLQDKLVDFALARGVPQDVVMAAYP